MYHICLLTLVVQNTNISLSRNESADTQMCLWDNNNSEAFWQVINKHYSPKFNTRFKLPLTISWSKTLLEDSILPQLVKKFPYFMGPEGLLPCLQELPLVLTQRQMKPAHTFPSNFSDWHQDL